MNGIVVYILLFVDDGLIFTKDCNVLNDIVKILENRFEITVCELNIFVGMRVVRERAKKVMILHQTDYAYKVLKRFYMLDDKPVCTPIEKGIDISLMKEHDPDCEKLPYRELIGSLMFLSTVSRPDIVYAVNFLSRFLDSFTRSHWDAAKQILKYIKGTVNRGIMYRNSGSVLELVGYCDSDYAGGRKTRRSTSGFVFKFCNGPVSWCTQRERTVSLSSTEAEYISATTATREAVWLRQLLHDIGSPCASATVLHIDNQSAIQLVKNPVFHGRTKHIEIQYHFIREKYENKNIDVVYIPSELQLADVFTKALARDAHQRLCAKIGLCCLDVSTFLQNTQIVGVLRIFIVSNMYKDVCLRELHKIQSSRVYTLYVNTLYLKG